MTQACGTRRTLNGERRARLVVDAARQAIGDLFTIPLVRHEMTKAECLGGLDLAAECSKRFRDMTYIWLAQSLSCLWITSDEKVLRGGSKNFPSKHVVLFSDIDTD